MASEPPVCEESTLNPGNTPFGDYEPVPNLSTPMTFRFMFLSVLLKNTERLGDGIILLIL